MSQKIESIVEAFSMQPAVFRIEKELGKYSKPELTLKNIEREELITDYENGQGNQRTCYVGYNHNGVKMFQYLAHTVNVHYETFT